MKKATFSAGCFWKVEEEFRKIEGVLSTTVGYTGGSVKNPTYFDVCSGKTGHAESIEILYDPNKISYDKLLAVFWKIQKIDNSEEKDNNDNSQYRSVIFFHDLNQKNAALRSIESIQKSDKYNGKDINTQISKAEEFFKAEEYHQKYFSKRGIKTNLVKK